MKRVRIVVRPKLEFEWVYPDDFESEEQFKRFLEQVKMEPEQVVADVIYYYSEKDIVDDILDSIGKGTADIRVYVGRKRVR